MNRTPVALLAALAALLAIATLAPVASAEAKSFTVTGFAKDGAFYFEFEGITGQNPTVPVAAGDVVTITYKTDSNVHNFHVGAPVNQQTTIVGPDAAAQTLTFTVPSTAATIEYWCDPHKASNNMKGTFAVSGTSTPTPTPTPSAKSDTPGFEAAFAVLALAGAVLLARRS